MRGPARRADADLAEYAAVEGGWSGCVVLPFLMFWHWLEVGSLGQAKVGVFRHAAAYLAARRGVVDLENYEANTTYFPVRFRPS